MLYAVFLLLGVVAVLLAVHFNRDDEYRIKVTATKWPAGDAG